MRTQRHEWDERQLDQFKTICTRLYLITMTVVWAVVMYRSLILGQETEQYEDLAILMTANVLVFICANLYSLGIPAGRISARVVAFVYLGFVALGIIFVSWKYRGMGLAFLLDKYLIVAAICAILVVIYWIATLLGGRHLEKQLSE